MIIRRKIKFSYIAKRLSLLQDNTKYFNVVANLQEKTLYSFNTVSRSINESNNNITENNKTLTESINNLLCNHYHKSDTFR